MPGVLQFGHKTLKCLSRYSRFSVVIDLLIGENWFQADSSSTAAASWTGGPGIK